MITQNLATRSGEEGVWTLPLQPKREDPAASVSSSGRDVGVEDLTDHSPLAFDLQQMEEVGEGDA